MGDLADPIPADDRARLVALAGRLGMTEWPAPTGTLVAVGDGETFYELVLADGRVAYVETQRGHAVTRATFDSVGAGVSHLAAVLARDAPRPEPAPATQTSTLRPRPVETPPPDPAAASETEAALTAAAELGWDRLPDAEGDVLTVGRDGTGRIIGFRHEVFEYRSFAGDHRTIQATASTAAAARRLLVIEAAAIARMQRRQQPVQLRVRGPAVDFTVTKGPTEFVVEGSGIRATFPLGPVGQQRALTFSYCADARLEDIVASYRDPGGAPLLTAGR